MLDTIGSGSRLSGGDGCMGPVSALSRPAAVSPAFIALRVAKTSLTTAA